MRWEKYVQEAAAAEVLLPTRVLGMYLRACVSKWFVYRLISDEGITTNLRTVLLWRCCHFLQIPWQFLFIHWPYFSFLQLIFPGEENSTDTTAFAGDAFHFILECPSHEVFLSQRPRPLAPRCSGPLHPSSPATQLHTGSPRLWRYHDFQWCKSVRVARITLGRVKGRNEER